MNKDLMFNKLVFDSELEKDEFEKYVNIKGVFLYKQIYDYLLIDNDKVQYSILSSCIRYDKNLRDKLYIYLATAEEYLKKQILDLYDLKDNVKFKFNNRSKISKYNQMKNFYLNNMLLRDDKVYNSNLYYNFKIDIGLILEICRNKKILNDSELTEWNNVRLLRNEVMHHQVLSISYDLKKNNEYKEEIVKKIISLSKCLPCEYRLNFINDINNLLCESNSFKINI